MGRRERGSKGRPGPGRGEVWTPPPLEETSSEEGGSRILLGRQVEGSSITALNTATHGLGKKIQRHRVLDVFTLGLVYEPRLRDARKSSPLENPPTIEDIAERFAKLSDRVESLAEPVVADVVDVRNDRGEVAVYARYPSLLEEQHILANALSRYFEVPHLHAPGPEEPHIVIIEKSLSRDEQISRIESVLPDKLSLSPLQPIDLHERTAAPGA